jgi:hypothetical protein
MKITVDVPDEELRDVMRFTMARTKQDAILTAVREFNGRRRMAELANHAGTCNDLITSDDLQRLRRRS